MHKSQKGFIDAILFIIAIIIVFTWLFLDDRATPYKEAVKQTLTPSYTPASGYKGQIFCQRTATEQLCKTEEGVIVSVLTRLDYGGKITISVKCDSNSGKNTCVTEKGSPIHIEFP